MNKKKIPLNVFSKFELEDPEQISDIITKYKIHILYTGANRNGSFITNPVADDMAAHSAGIPIVGIYSGDKGDFIAHEGAVVNGNYLSTQPYGFIPTNAKFTWESKLDDDGITRNYLTTSAYLWRGRYPELAILDVAPCNNLSMELSYLSEGDWDGSGRFVFSKMIATGMCILGKDVEPCFEGADFVGEFSYNAHSKVIEDMKDELMKAIQGETKMTKNDVTPAVVFSKEEEKKEPVVDGGCADCAVPEATPTAEPVADTTPEPTTPEATSEPAAEPETSDPDAEYAKKKKRNCSEDGEDDDEDGSDKDKKIAELEAKIAELEKELEKAKKDAGDYKLQAEKFELDCGEAQKKLKKYEDDLAKNEYVKTMKDYLIAEDYAKLEASVGELELDALKSRGMDLALNYLKSSIKKLAEPTKVKEPATDYSLAGQTTIENNTAPWIKEVQKREN